MYLSYISARLYWSREMGLLLVTLWEQHKPAFEKNRNQAECWRKLAKIFNQSSDIQEQVTGGQLHDKWKKMREK